MARGVSGWAPAPAFAQGKDWDRLLRGLMVIGFDNRGGRLATPLRGDESPEDAEFFFPVPLVEHTDLWALGLDDEDQIVFRGVGTCPDRGSSESTGRAIGDLLHELRKTLEKPEPKPAPRGSAQEKAYRMFDAFLKNMRVEREGQSIIVHCSGVGTFSEFASLVREGVVEF